jgi:hypothetical protein
VHDAEVHARLDGGGLRGGELVVELPLQPAVKVDGLGLPAAKDATAGPAGCCSSSATGASRCRTSRRARTRGEVVEAAALRWRYAAYASSRPPTVSRRTRFQRGTFRLPRGVAIDPLGLLRRRLRLDTRLADAAALPDVCELVDASTRRYSGLMNLRDVGRYGDGSIGGVGAAACSGLTRTKPAPCCEADHTARSARSVKSPMPQERFERTL